MRILDFFYICARCLSKCADCETMLNSVQAVMLGILYRSGTVLTLLYVVLHRLFYVVHTVVEDLFIIDFCSTQIYLLDYRSFSYIQVYVLIYNILDWIGIGKL